MQLKKTLNQSISFNEELYEGSYLLGTHKISFQITIDIFDIFLTFLTFFNILDILDIF